MTGGPSIRQQLDSLSMTVHEVVGRLELAGQSPALWRCSSTVHAEALRNRPGVGMWLTSVVNLLQAATLSISRRTGTD